MPGGTALLHPHLARRGFDAVFDRAKPVDLDDGSWKKRPLRPQWIPFPDLLEAYALAATVTDVQFEVITIVGDSSGRRWDLSKAERILGYRPQHRLEDLGYTLGDETVSGERGRAPIR